MQDLKRIDLHTHSFFSDGTESPTVLMELARKRNIDVVALTDHDTTAGWDEAEVAAQTYAIEYVPGIELSTTDTSSEVQKSIHLLGYFFDPTYAPLVDFCQDIRTKRILRAQHIVERLSKEYDVSWQGVLAQLRNGATVGRPHIADALVANNIVENRKSAFDTLLHSQKHYFSPLETIDVHEGIELIRAAGGVCVLAHPVAYARQSFIPEKRIQSLVKKGLAGLEIEHRDNSAEGKQYLYKMAQTYDLIVTGASDYHGSGKPNLLGEHTTSPGQFARLKQCIGYKNAFETD